jgi:signal transduction histidine kinase
VETVINPVFSPEGKIYKYLSINYEISERKQLEQHQAALLKDLSEYAFLTSHELRGPLARILGLTALFQMGEDAKLIIEKLQEEAKAMDEVIRRMNNTLMRNSHELISRERAQRSAIVKL